MRTPRASPNCATARRADVSGTVLVLTLGTGIGSALFVDGRLVPNTEFGHLEVAGREAEKRASGRAKVDQRT